MIKKLLIFLTTFFILLLLFFLSPGIFINRNVAEAAKPANSLTADASCDNTNSKITFGWYAMRQDNAVAYLWYTGNSDNGGLGTQYDNTGGNVSITIDNLPYNTTFDWHVTIKNTDFCLIDCEKRTDGSPITSSDCSASPPPTTYDCSQQGQCVQHSGAGTGNFTSLTDCSQRCTATQNFDCRADHRSPECSDLNVYPVGKCFTFTEDDTFHECPSIDPGITYRNCAMQNTSDPSRRYSCAYNAGYTCRAEGSTGCTLDSQCCSGWCDGRSNAGGGVCRGTENRAGQECDPQAPNCMDNYACVPNPDDNTRGTCQAVLNNDLNNPYGNAPLPTAICAEGAIAGGTCTVLSALGNIPTTAAGFIKTLLGIILSLSGGIALLLIIRSGYHLMTSQGNPEQLQAAREQLTAAIVGLLFVIFSLVALQVIGYDILRLPTFGQ